MEDEIKWQEELDKPARLSFRNQLRDARHKALRDGEAFEDIIYAVERVGSYLCYRLRDAKKCGDLGKYKDLIVAVAKSSALFEIPEQQRGLRTPFPKLYDMVKDARNDALHQGAFARHLTIHAIQLALVLEDAMMRSDHIPAVVGDFMVFNPVCAELWQPIAYIRQQMLANSFSYLPVKNKEGVWCLISDLDVAKYLQKADAQKERNKRLAQSLDQTDSQIQLLPAKWHYDDDPISDVIASFDGKPILVHHHDDGQELVGILTAFDLL